VIISRPCSVSCCHCRASHAAARRVQDCNSPPSVLVRQRPRLPGRRLSARRQRPCQTTAFSRHSNTRCQSDAQQFWRQDLCKLPPQDHKSGTVCRPISVYVGCHTARPQLAQAHPRCTKCNSPPINGQCTNHRIAVTLRF